MRNSDIFWNNHNPTTPNRQGPDIGTQYRSSIFFHDKEQEAAAKESKERVNQSRKFGNGRIVTEIKPASKFYKAEEYHQQYFQKCGLTH
jgi:peptide-methionine (S)-S-oxide reductase